MERAMGIEPTSEAWEASILPLYDARSLLLIILSNRFYVQPFDLYSLDFHRAGHAVECLLVAFFSVSGLAAATA
jgi:hypothetical protein